MKRDSATKSPTSSQKNEAKKSKGNTSYENKNDKVTNLKGGAQSNNGVEATILFNPIDVAAILAKDNKFDIPTLKRDVAAITNSIFEEGLLSPRRFQQMEEFEHGEYRRSYIHKYYDMSFEHTYKLHAEIDKVLVGALKVLNEIDKMLQSCKKGDLEGFISAFNKGWEENEKLRKKVGPYFELMCRIRLREDFPKMVQRIEELGGGQWKLKILNSSIESSSSSEEG